MTRTENAVRNISWGFIQKIITLLLPFLVRTVLIKVLGADYLGLNSLFTSVLGLLNLAELGISSAIISTMYKPITDHDTYTICALMAFYKKAYHIIGIVIMVVGMVVMPFIPKLIKGDVPNDIDIYILFLIYLFNTSISYFLFAYKNCLFIAHQRNDINSKIQTLCVAFQNIIQIIVVLFYKNYYLFVIVIPVFSVLTNIITAILAKRSYPEYVCRGTLSKEVKHDIKKRVGGLVIARISATVRSTIDSMFLTKMLGLTIAGMYSNYFYVVTAVAGMIQVIETSLVAGVGNSIVVDSVEKNHHDFIKFTFMLQWIVGWCAVSVLCLEQPFMRLWVGEELMFNDSMVVLCALYLFINCICLIRSIYTQALGMWWTLKYLSLFDIFANLFLNYFLGKRFGAYGILVATIIDIVLVSIPWTTYFLFRDYFGLKNFFSYIFGYVKYFSIAVIIAIFTFGICFIFKSKQAIFELIKNGAICLVVPNIMYYLIFFRTKIFKEVVMMLKRRLNIER